MIWSSHMWKCIIFFASLIQIVMTDLLILYFECSDYERHPASQLNAFIFRKCMCHWLIQSRSNCKFNRHVYGELNESQATILGWYQVCDDELTSSLNDKSVEPTDLVSVFFYFSLWYFVEWKIAIGCSVYQRHLF